MKQILVLTLVLAMLLGGCGAKPAPTVPTTEATTEATTEPTTVPTTEPAPVYTNPLTGEVIDAPIDTRIFAVSINNLEKAIPHYGIPDADIFMEMFVNGSIIRGLAMFADPSDVNAIGAVRSTRPMFTDISLRYNAIVAHAGGDERVLKAAAAKGAEGINMYTADETYFSFRDMNRRKSGYAIEHCLFAKGTGLKDRAVEKGIDIAQDPDRTYGLTFVEDGTPVNGEIADTITLTFTSYGRKSSTMVYNEDLGKYIYHQYKKEMADGITGEPEAFENVVIMLGDVYMNELGYHECNFTKGGTGYYACNGMIIPILWSCEGQYDPFHFTTIDGEPLSFGVGNTYLAIATEKSPVEWEDLTPPPETTAETISEEVAGE